MPGPRRRRPVVAGQRALQRREAQTAQNAAPTGSGPAIASEAALRAGEEQVAHQERELGAPLGLPPGLTPEAADELAAGTAVTSDEGASAGERSGDTVAAADAAAIPTAGQAGSLAAGAWSEPTSTPTPDAGAWERPVRSARGLNAALAVLLLALAGTAYLIGWPHQAKDRYTEERVDALAAAQSAAVDLLSVNYESIEAGQKKAASHLAPQFLGEYTRFFDSLRTTAVKNKLVLSSHVEAGGVTSIKDADHVVVLLFIDQISTNAQRASPRIDQNRVRLRMVHRGGKWLVEGLDAI